MNANLVFKWIRDPRFRPTEEDKSVFLPVEVVAEPEVAVTTPPVMDGRIELSLSNGHRLSIIGAFDPDAVTRLVRGLNE